MSTKFNKAGKILKFLLKIIVALLFIVSIFLVVVFTFRFGSGHWVTVCSTAQSKNGGGRSYGSIYFSDKEQCDHEDWPKITVWVKDPSTFNLNFLNNINILRKNNPQTATLKSTPSPTQPPTTKPTPKTPGYSVTILSKPTINNINVLGRDEYKLSLPVKIENISVKPFITSFTFSSCDVYDTNGNPYPQTLDRGDAFSGVTFNKAIFPGQSITVTLLSVPIVKSTSKCAYNDNGENVCQTVAFSRIDKCQPVVSGGSSNDLGQGPLSVPQ